MRPKRRDAGQKDPGRRPIRELRVRWAFPDGDEVTTLHAHHLDRLEQAAQAFSNPDFSYSPVGDWARDVLQEAAHAMVAYQQARLDQAARAKARGLFDERQKSLIRAEFAEALIKYGAKKALGRKWNCSDRTIASILKEADSIRK